MVRTPLAPAPARRAVVTRSLAAAALLATACGTTGSTPHGAPVFAPPSVETTRSWPPPAETTAASPVPVHSGARARAALEPPAAAPAPEERPGLATSWGERRDSVVEEVAFTRDSAPLAVATLHYDDAAGVSALAARARLELPRPAPIRVGPGFSVSVVDEAGSPLPALFLDGTATGRVFVVGETGRRYALSVRNDTGQRVEVVASVDGLDVVDGRPATLARRGYLVEPWSSVTIEGFRTSLADVAAFRFGTVADSYAARTGDASDVGVIGFAFFGERAPVRDDRFAAPPFDAARDAEAARRLQAHAF